MDAHETSENTVEKPWSAADGLAKFAQSKDWVFVPGMWVLGFSLFAVIGMMLGVVLGIASGLIAAYTYGDAATLTPELVLNSTALAFIGVPMGVMTGLFIGVFYAWMALRAAAFTRADNPVRSLGAALTGGFFGSVLTALIFSLGENERVVSLSVIGGLLGAILLLVGELVLQRCPPPRRREALIAFCRRTAMRSTAAAAVGYLVAVIAVSLAATQFAHPAGRFSFIPFVCAFLYLLFLWAGTCVFAGYIALRSAREEKEYEGIVEGR